MRDEAIGDVAEAAMLAATPFKTAGRGKTLGEAARGFGTAARAVPNTTGRTTVVTNNAVGNSFDNYVLGTKLKGLDERGLVETQQHLATPELAGLGKNYVKPDYSIYTQNGQVAAYADAKTGAAIPFDLQARGLVEWSTTTNSKTLIYYTPEGTTQISPSLLNYARQRGVQIKQVGVP